MARFIRVKGVRGALVPHPAVSGLLMVGQHQRYLAQKLVVGADGLPVSGKSCEMYEPSVEWVEDSATVRKAIRKGSLEKLGEVVSSSMPPLVVEPAAKDSSSKPASRVAKGGE